MDVDHNWRDNGRPSGNACSILASPFDRPTDRNLSRCSYFPTPDITWILASCQRLASW
jgi:hypothetical protein